MLGDRSAIADVVRAESEPVGILASSDLNHYEDQNTTMEKDDLAFQQVVCTQSEDCGKW